ncbi:hypothetical protein D9758_007695 [Tetrapyrgos nigripes]|uniref:Uncharacterized protein n=1 Tax=Tetrapyrgos nigripes TaxID=182062 RepID=A0A8H5G5G0_9AGAR|nr:hypothetical protein D9758_007695 [Tetrapyrgos nigripes]
MFFANWSLDDYHPSSPRPYHKIIDCVEDLRPGSDPSESKATLQACSLVCKSWLPRSRRYLFREIRIGPNFAEPETGERHVSREAIDQEIANFAPRARVLLEIPERSSCLSEDVISSVRKLTISCALPITQIFRTSFFGNLPFTTLEEISLRHSDRVQREKAYDPSDPPVSIDSQSFSELLKKNPKLHCLALHSLDFSGYDQIVEIISSLSQHTHFHTLSLHELHFNGLRPLSLGEKIRSKCDPRRRLLLRTLGVQPFHELYNVLFLLAPGRARYLATKIPGSTFHFRLWTCSVILHTITRNSGSMPVDSSPTFFLHKLAQLEYLELRGIHWFLSFQRLEAVVIPILSALSLSSPGRIRYLVLRFHLRPGKLECRWIQRELSSLDSALSVLPSSLIELRLQYYHEASDPTPPEDEDWEEWLATDDIIRSWFPKAVGSGCQKDTDSKIPPCIVSSSNLATY